MSANEQTTPVARYGRLVEADLRSRPDAVPGWLEDLAGAANEAFRTHGFPDRRDENWRYTTLSALLEQPFQAAEPNEALQDSDVEDLLIDGLEGWRVVLVNGRYAPALSALQELPAGVWVGGFAEALDLHGERVRKHLSAPSDRVADAFANLNLAAAGAGAVVLVGPGVRLDRPIEVLHVAVGADEPQIMQPRQLVVLGERSEATLVERYVSLGDSSYFTNLAVDIHLGEGAVLRHHYVQEESPSAYHMRSQRLTQSADSAYEGLGCAIGAGWSRADWRVDFAGSGASCALRGLYVVGDRQLADNHLDMHHRVPRCTSQEDFRGVLNGRGRAVFDGRIVVHQDAQQTDARLRNDNLMLSRDAEVDTKPQLEIFADDVACSHGTTVGQIEPEQLFYLRSRGIPEAQAKRMICLGFAQSVLEGVSIPALVNHLGKVVGERLASEVNV